MISRIRGKVLGIVPDGLIIEVAQLGFEMTASRRLLSSCKVGEEVSLFTRLEIKDEQLQLYAFGSEQERHTFIELRSVRGVGARIAFAFLGVFSANDLMRAIENEDVKLLTTVPGCGAKMAKRLVLELRERLPAKDVDNGWAATNGAPQSAALSDCLLALESLGWRRSEVWKITEETALANPLDSSQDLLRQVLRSLNSNKSGGENERR